MSEIALQTFNLARTGKQGCLFCDPFPIMHINNTENFNLLADTFPVISGHLMISSKAHYGCAGELPDELQVELIKIKNAIAATIRRNGKQVIFYEHGRAGCCLANNPDGSKCEHFHLHVLPVAVDITQHLDQSLTKINMQIPSCESPTFTPCFMPRNISILVKIRSSYIGVFIWLQISPVFSRDLNIENDGAKAPIFLLIWCLPSGAL